MEEEKDGCDWKAWAFPFSVFSFSSSVNATFHVIRAQGLRAPDSRPGS